MTTNIWSIKENSDILDFSKFWNVALQTLEENEKKQAITERKYLWIMNLDKGFVCRIHKALLKLKNKDKKNLNLIKIEVPFKGLSQKLNSKFLTFISLAWTGWHAPEL